ncbi:MAG TPA: hydroxyacylglutathione hydrolase [Afifellaceae bacterium]|nr:hydroxyacylglutathione hydrolase [Afifellaceae bacterium]
MAELEIVQFTARSDNFAVLVHDPQSGKTASIDAPEAAPILAELENRGWQLTDIFVTHKHLDHIDGIPALKETFGAAVTGPAKSARETGLYDRTVSDGHSFDFAGHTVQVMETPGHTLDHVSYYIADQKLLFCADTLFALGCGRVFEGDAPMMWNSLKALRDLPDDTVVYCGHEYTLANARFAVTADPQNGRLAERLAEIETLRADGRPTLPTSIGLEKETNPFLRADDPAVAAAMGLSGADPAAVFAEVRARKDNF